MSRLIVVSNRVGPVKDAGRAGGLAVALVEALSEQGGIWYGWSGKTGNQADGRPQLQTIGSLTLATLDLTPGEYEEYYNGFANRCLWPLFHYRLDLTAFNRQYYEGYRKVNAKFAQSLQPLLQNDDLIWVHDYHFMLLANELRHVGSTQSIGFFLHIPFPSREILASLPTHDVLIRALFAYDVVGFQTEGDCDRFKDYVVHEAGGSVHGNRVRAFGRTILADVFPIGIDAAAYADIAANSEEACHQYQNMVEMLGGRVQIIGVDRLDYTKGLPERFASYERLLEDYPDLRGRVSYLQIAPPSRGQVKAYQEIRHELEALTGNINGHYSEFDWTPLRYLNRSFNRRALAGLYRASKIGLVTPLRDGMNLVAKEYIAAQDPENPGVLILSRFAGSAQQMTDALIVNPYDIKGVADTLQKARYMSRAERIARYQTLMEGLKREDVTHWRDEFLNKLESVGIGSHIGQATGTDN